jgi:DNA repair protein RadC
MNNLFTNQESIAEVQITYSSKTKSADRIKITSSSDADKAFRIFWPSFEHVEFAYLLLLNRQNQIIGSHFLAKGGMTGTVVDIRAIFQVALKSNATSIMFAHNHPSGNLQPSDADMKITRQIKDAGVLLDIPLLDHIILTTESYMSFADEGFL